MKTFNGGMHISDNKALCNSTQVEVMPIVPDYYVLLSQHIGAPATPVVATGDVVKEGQLIAKASSFVSANIYSPVCGEVIGIEKVKNAVGASVDAVHIKANGEQDVVTLKALPNATKEQIIERVAEAGIVGMGGAGFPTAIKLQPKTPVDTLIINAAECEPYLTCDDYVMQERTHDFLEGVKLLAKALDVTNIIIGLEANKMNAYNTLISQEGVVDAESKNAEGIKVQLVKKKYPQGAEKTLIYACTKRKVACGGLPAEVGVVVNNVGTALAVYEAVVLGKPLYRRYTTVSGRGIGAPKNIEVRTGTPLSSVIDFCGGLSGNECKVIAGGPMMGRALTELNVYTTKTDSGYLALTKEETSLLEPTACINCGKCASVCPMHLMPMYIDFYTNAGDYETAAKYGAQNCFECGTCAYVCPAKRDIVASVRKTKSQLRKK